MPPIFFEEDGRKIILGDEQIQGAIAVAIESDHRARIVEHDFVEAGFGSDVAKAGRAFVAKQHDAAFAGESFADGDEIDPAVIVVIESGDAPGAHANSRSGSATRSNDLPSYVAPQAQARRRPVREGEVHPAVFIEIERDDTGGGCGHVVGPRSGGAKGAFALIHEERREIFAIR